MDGFFLRGIHGDRDHPECIWSSAYAAGSGAVLNPGSRFSGSGAGVGGGQMQYWTRSPLQRGRVVVADRQLLIPAEVCQQIVDWRRGLTC